MLFGMLQIGRTTLPRIPLVYVAFRNAMLDTAERMSLAQQMGTVDCRPLGYLTEVPFLKRCAPQVQIDVLLETWRKHLSPSRHVGTLLDEAVVYAVCESTARMVEREAHVVSRLLDGGPLAHTPPLTSSLAERLRKLHLELDGDGDFLLVSQFEDIPPEEAEPLRKKFGLSLDRTAALEEPLERWRMRPSWPTLTRGLMNPSEKTRLAVQIGGYLAACAPGRLAEFEEARQREYDALPDEELGFDGFGDGQGFGNSLGPDDDTFDPLEDDPFESGSAF